MVGEWNNVVGGGVEPRTCSDTASGVVDTDGSWVEVVGVSGGVD